MRKEEVKSEEFNDDVSDLKLELKNQGISYKIKRQEILNLQVKKMYGFYPTRKWHMHIGRISVIRGFTSLGMYEAFGGKFKEPKKICYSEGICKLFTYKK